MTIVCTWSASTVDSAENDSVRTWSKLSPLQADETVLVLRRRSLGRMLYTFPAHS
jgi:hypothetical protein